MVRSALTLASLTGLAVRVYNIRAGRRVARASSPSTS
ncbi:MAG: hypothetical protein HS130_05630 [Deltaproteobacteria bacterium]|nr:hypothetical protein [Deltaproteobacteria bacterium]